MARRGFPSVAWVRSDCKDLLHGLSQAKNNLSCERLSIYAISLAREVLHCHGSHPQYRIEGIF